MRLLPLVAAALLAGCATSVVPPPSPGAPAASLACADPCATVAAEGSVHEPWVAVDPEDPRHVVAGGFGRSGESSSFPVAVTFDGGATWERSTLGPVRFAADPAFEYSQAGDIMIGFANDGTVLVAGLVRHGARAPQTGAADVDLALWRSTDGGRTFGEGRIIVDSTGLFAGSSLAPVPRATAGEWTDKEFLVVDRATGEAHVLWNAVQSNVQGVFFSGTEIRIIHSRDAGQTWTEPSVVATGRYGVSAAAHEGILLVTFRNPGYLLTRSADAGRTWSAPEEVGDLPGPDGTWQAAPVALWPANGTLHAALALASGDDGGRVEVRRSEDGGASWSAGVVAFPEVASAKRNPTMAVDPATGRGVLAAYQGTDAMQVWAAPLVDGVPQAAFAVSDLTAASYLFEYFGAAAAGDAAYVAWADEAQDASPLMVARLGWGSP